MNEETEKQMTDEKEKALKAFLLDIDCLDPLSEWTNKLNIFDVLKITRTEIRHSNMLAWLLDPNESHGLGDKVIRGVIQYVVDKLSLETKDVFDMLLMDCYELGVLREWCNIDIMAVSDKQKFVLCIENKIDSPEHDDQLPRYKKIIDETYKDYTKLFIFLTPDGVQSSDPDNWHPMGYENVVKIIEEAKKNVHLQPEAELLIKNYTETLRRNIVEDEKLTQICAEIYRKHKLALDLIFEKKMDSTSKISDVLKQWAREKTKAGEIEFSEEKSTKTFVRFKTKAMSELLPDDENVISGWGSNNVYFYEILINQDGFRMQYALCSINITDELRTMCERINKHLPSRVQKEKWQWRLPFTTKYKKYDDDYSKEHLFEMVNELYKEMMKKEAELIAAIKSEGTKL